MYRCVISAKKVLLQDNSLKEMRQHSRYCKWVSICDYIPRCEITMLDFTSKTNCNGTAVENSYSLTFNKKGLVKLCIRSLAIPEHGVLQLDHSIW